MYYFTPDTIFEANKRIESLDAKAGGLLCILRCLEEDIRENVSYTINGELLRRELSFVFDKEPKDDFDYAKSSYIIFAKDWVNTFFNNVIKNKVDLLSCAVFFLRRYGFEREYSKQEIVDIFIKRYNLKNYKDKWFFDNSNLDLKFNQNDVERNQTDFYYKKQYNTSFKSILFNGVIQKSAADLKAAGQVQTLYSGSGIQKCFLLSDEPLDQYYILSNTKQNEVVALQIEAESLPDLSVDELGTILSNMYNNPSGSNKTTAVHMFGIKYGAVITRNHYTCKAICDAAGLGDTQYDKEVNKGVNIYKSINDNEYGIKFYDGEKHDERDDNPELPQLPKRIRKRYPLNSILYGAPGTGKTFATAPYAIAIIEDEEVSEIMKEERPKVMARYKHYIASGRIVFTTFHQNYGYEDFIQGIRPDTSTDEISFKTVDGVFKSIVDRAIYDPNNDYVIIIDEINRANISKVFGELISLIEEDKRWGEENEISVTLPSGDTFAVPNNLYIIGTMNSADKSISLIDTALRRRFEFIEYTPDLNLVDDKKLRAVLEKLNKGISKELNSVDLLIGHSYFMHYNINDLDRIMNRNVIPLLYEYFFDNQKKVEAQIKDATEGTDFEIKSDTMGRLKVEKKETN